ncbi:GntR family transcriptional regulator [Mycobacterium avium subsp. hominissuis]
MTNRSQTRVDEVYGRLRSEILAGRLAPGARLPFAELSQRYNTSTGVLREALPRLVEQGLVVSKPQIGFRVVEVSPEDLRHLTEARVVIESLALRQSVEQGDLAWESEVLAAHHTMRGLPMLTSGLAVNEAWLEAHAYFHSTLLRACPNSRLTKIADMLRDSAEIYRCWSAQYGQEQGRDVAGEHQRILDAALARKADEATTALSDHIELTTEILLQNYADTIGVAGSPPPD